MLKFSIEGQHIRMFLTVLTCLCLSWRLAGGGGEVWDPSWSQQTLKQGPPSGKEWQRKMKMMSQEGNRGKPLLRENRKGGPTAGKREALPYQCVFFHD